jgi:hypothetical protein
MIGVLDTYNEQDEFPCVECGAVDWIFTREGCRACGDCGLIDSKYQSFDYGPSFCQPDRAVTHQRKRANRQVADTLAAAGAKFAGGGVISFGPRVQLRGRYRERFHFNERIAQWSMADPPIPDVVWERLEAEADSGEYGSREDFTRATVIRMLRILGLETYRERWKTVLGRLTQKELPSPPANLLLWMEEIFERVVVAFRQYRDTMPMSMAKGKDGELKLRERHNFPSYNYVKRKMLEARGIYDYHQEFPIPRSHLKLHALDDVFEKMAEYTAMPFERSVVIKRPKLKRNNRK